MNYWQRWIGDWKRKTAHLSAEQKGIYGELLDHAYATERPLPIDTESLYRIAGATSESERKSCDRVISEFFIADDAGVHNKRVHEEIIERARFVGAQRERATRRWDRVRDNKSGTEAKRRRGNGEDDPAPTITATIWGAYSIAYRERYGVEPTRNAKSNALLKQFSARVPVDDAPKVAAFYLHSQRALYVGAKHPLTLLLRDAESLRTEFLTGATTDDSLGARNRAAAAEAVRQMNEEIASGKS